MKLEERIDELLNTIEKDNRVIKGNFYISIGTRKSKADIKFFRKTNNAKRDIINHIEKYIKKNRRQPEWIKFDLITSVEDIFFDDLVKMMINTRRNYIEYGIAFDDMWNLSFLPEVINANAFLKPDKTGRKLMLSETNINHYLLKYTNQKNAFSSNKYTGKRVKRFYTKGYFLEEDKVYILNEKGYAKGLRQVDNISQELDRLIEKSTDYLAGEINENGKYNYGYFPHFDRKISFYNNLRHASSTYSLIEGLNYTGKDISIAERPLKYLIDNYILKIEQKGFIFDDTNNINEVKLGQNAAFIFAICEYLKVNKNQEFLEAAQLVANGMASMIDIHGNTIHVLNYPNLSVKEKFRIIYYDGEAALAFLRLYQIDGNKKWLELVEKMFEKFISHNYWKYNDHWLGYCTNELVQLNPDVRYFELGIRNAAGQLDFIEKRETTFPTFLEMMMATYHLIQKAKSEGLNELVDQLIDEEKLLRIIHKRADYQRVGFFYPETAMYFKNPERILDGFFIKHHGYRVRIDDIEHYLSGFVQYQQVFKNRQERG
ncbi:Poly(Glycerol-phosphate) alpha-glucosyltransferase [Macrococcoides canis]|uniref:Poly(Glycerol-phosphate) alpha-glucosyltransferase n=1 Tax=Macrococcoides canis TaxID=1855823 RepID=A0A1W7AE78_9STAP|nr:poly(glycerol-phosphate) alpha-glucosyltransferase [Macrococcus canis]ARQ07909.1 hypothetical protein MCCS_23290 [Macrococcus canis]UJS27597.1 poly(glycerol-phosphate) alpha-glucosyltransferase [Macrococcus canis]